MVPNFSVKDAAVLRGWLEAHPYKLGMVPNFSVKDAAVLRGWLEAHPPAAPAASGLAAQVVSLFEHLNARLRADLGPQYQVGHSYFMVSPLDEGRLRAVWQHQVRPLLEEYALSHPGRLVSFELEDFLGDGRRPGRKRPTAPSPF
jgi:hypothetical protein